MPPVIVYPPGSYVWVNPIFEETEVSMDRWSRKMFGPKWVVSCALRAIGVGPGFPGPD